MRSLLRCPASPLAFLLSHGVRHCTDHPVKGNRFQSEGKSNGHKHERENFCVEQTIGAGMVGSVLRRTMLVCLLVGAISVTLATRVAAQSNPATNPASQGDADPQVSSQNAEQAAVDAAQLVTTAKTALATFDQNLKKTGNPSLSIKPEKNTEELMDEVLPQSREAGKPYVQPTAPDGSPIDRRNPISVETRNDCPVFNQNLLMSQIPTIQRQVGNGSWRPAATNDFLILEYNAKSLQTRWYDYHRPAAGHTYLQSDPPHSIFRNGEFLPIVYAKEKMLVHVCGLHFTDIVSVSANSTGVAESGLDIRGSNPTTTIPTLGAALDSIQAVGATGQAATIGGLGFSTTPSITTGAATGVANGTVSRAPGGLTYGDAQITASPEELALLMYGLIRNGIELSKSIKGDDLTLNAAVSPNDLTHDFLKQPATSINRIALEATERFNQTYKDRRDPVDRYNPAAFDRDMTDIQNFSTELTNFFGTLSSQGYGSRAVALWSNYAILRAPLNMMKDHMLKHNCILSTEAQIAQAAADQAAETAIDATIALAEAQKKFEAAKEGSSEKADLQKALKTKKEASDDAQNKLTTAQKEAIKKLDSTTPSNPPLNCDDWESTNFNDFLTEYKARLRHLAHTDPGTEDIVLHWKPTQMFQDLGQLRSTIVTVTDIVGYLYKEINLWNDKPLAEQLDYITPISGNALQRISISVQHAYVPFTLSSYALSTAPTVNTPAAPTITTAASTSTPAHTVKTVMVEVHRRVNLNLIGGVMDIRVPNFTYAVQSGTTPAALATPTPTPTPNYPLGTPNPPPTGTNPTSYTYTFTFNGICNNTPGVVGTTSFTQAANTVPPSPPTMTPGYTCVVQTQKSNYQLSAMVGLDFFLIPRDYFPFRRGLYFSKRNLIPAPYAVTSVTTLGNSSFGLNFEPWSGVDFLVGAGMANTAQLPAGVTPSTVLPSGYTLPSTTEVNWGFTWGVGFDFSLFSQIFSKGPSAASLP